MNQLELVDSGDDPYDDLVPFEAYTRGMQALRDNHRTYTDSVIHLTPRMAAKDASARKQALVFQWDIVQVYERKDPILTRDVRGLYLQTLKLAKALNEDQDNKDLLDQALGYLQWVLGDCAKKLGEANNFAREVVLEMGRANLARGELEEGTEQIGTVVDVRTAQYGEDHVDTLVALEMEAEGAWEMGLQARALDCLKDCIEEAKALVRFEHGFTKRMRERWQMWASLGNGGRGNSSGRGSRGGGSWGRGNRERGNRGRGSRGRGG